MTKTTFQINGMSCFTCENRIKTALLYIDGVHDCRANCVNGNLECEFDEHIVSIDQILQVLNTMGFALESCER